VIVEETRTKDAVTVKMTFSEPDSSSSTSVSLMATAAECTLTHTAYRPVGYNTAVIGKAYYAASTGCSSSGYIGRPYVQYLSGGAWYDHFFGDSVTVYPGEAYEKQLVSEKRCGTWVYRTRSVFNFQYISSPTVTLAHPSC
jgi:hypothetical protein